MKHRFIAVALLITALLSGCGRNQTIEVTTSIQEEQESQASIEIDNNWLKDKTFYCEDNGVYMWTDYLNGIIVVEMGKGSTRMRMGVWRDEEYNLNTLSEGVVQYVSVEDRAPVTAFSIAYVPMTTDIICVEREQETGTYTSLTGTYNLVSQEQPTETSSEPTQEQQPDDFYTDGDYTTYGRYQCFETDTFVSVETQNGSLVLYFEPEAETFVLDRNGADTGWEFINWEFEDKIYTSVTIQDNEMIISSTEPWRFDGTYIQLPDIGTDGEGE